MASSSCSSRQRSAFSSDSVGGSDEREEQPGHYCGVRFAAAAGVSQRNGEFTPAHVIGSTSVFVPTVFDLTFSFTPPGGPTKARQHSCQAQPGERDYHLWHPRRPEHVHRPRGHLRYLGHCHRVLHPRKGVSGTQLSRRPRFSSGTADHFAVGVTDESVDRAADAGAAAPAGERPANAAFHLHCPSRDGPSALAELGADRAGGMLRGVDVDVKAGGVGEHLVDQGLRRRGDASARVPVGAGCGERDHDRPIRRGGAAMNVGRGCRKGDVRTWSR